MNSKAEYIEVDLRVYQKKLVLAHAGFLLEDETTQADLKNGRKKWIRFRPDVISDVISELTYHFNRCNSDDKSELLDELISHLEFALAGGSSNSFF